MSTLLGNLISSGSVYLINPAGVLIGKTGRVDTAGNFVASTLNLSANDFMNGGQLVFTGDSKNVVVNLGDIYSQNGGVVLIGHDVSNAGSISAANGETGVAAGSQILLKESNGDQRIFVQAAGGDAVNTGTISAA